jgi:hypothetical protein
VPLRDVEIGSLTAKVASSIHSVFGGNGVPEKLVLAFLVPTQANLADPLRVGVEGLRAACHGSWVLVERQLESVFLPALLCALGEAGGGGGRGGSSGGSVNRKACTAEQSKRFNKEYKRLRKEGLSSKDAMDKAKEGKGGKRGKDGGTQAHMYGEKGVPATVAAALAMYRDMSCVAGVQAFAARVEKRGDLGTLTVGDLNMPGLRVMNLSAYFLLKGVRKREIDREERARKRSVD